MASMAFVKSKGHIGVEGWLQCTNNTQAYFEEGFDWAWLDISTLDWSAHVDLNDALRSKCTILPRCMRNKAVKRSPLSS